MCFSQESLVTSALFIYSRLLEPTEFTQIWLLNSKVKNLKLIRQYLLWQRINFFHSPWLLVKHILFQINFMLVTGWSGGFYGGWCFFCHANTLHVLVKYRLEIQGVRVPARSIVTQMVRCCNTDIRLLFLILQVKCLTHTSLWLDNTVIRNVSVYRWNPLRYIFYNY